MNRVRWLSSGWGRGVAAVAMALVLAVAGGYGFTLSRHDGSSGPLAGPAAGEIAFRVHALGRLEPAGRIRKITPHSGSETALVAELLVEEGQDVAAGDLLAVLDNHFRRKASLAESVAQLAAAQARLAQVQAGAKPGDIEAQREAVALHSAQLAFAERELARAQQLHARNVLPVEELDKKLWARDRLAIERRRAEQQLAALAEVRDVDVEVLAREVTAAEAAVERARAEFLASEVRAPVAGRILKIHTRTGERVGNDGLLELGDVSEMQAVAEVFEGDLPAVRPGQRAEVIVDSTGDTIPGEVIAQGHLVARKSILSNDPVSDTDARVVEVRVRLYPPADVPVEKLSNARVEVSIDVSSAPAAPSGESAPVEPALTRRAE